MPLRKKLAKAKTARFNMQTEVGVRRSSISKDLNNLVATINARYTVVLQTTVLHSYSRGQTSRRIKVKGFELELDMNQVADLDLALQHSPNTRPQTARSSFFNITGSNVLEVKYQGTDGLANGAATHRIVNNIFIVHQCRLRLSGYLFPQLNNSQS